MGQSGPLCQPPLRFNQLEWLAKAQLDQGRGAPSCMSPYRLEDSLANHFDKTLQYGPELVRCIRYTGKLEIHLADA